jgi:hypothetical protein
VKNKLIFPSSEEKADLRKLALEGNMKEVGLSRSIRFSSPTSAFCCHI